MIKRYWSFVLSVSLAIHLLSFFSASAFACGVERWSVKTGTDPDAHLVNLNAPTTTTISNLRSYRAESDPRKQQGATHRNNPVGDQLHPDRV